MLPPNLSSNSISLVRFSEDIQLMTGNRPGLYLCICWKFISPAIMTAILVAFLLKMIFGDVDYEVMIQLAYKMYSSMVILL